MYYQRFKTEDQRFAEKYDLVGECWQWRNVSDRYPHFWADGRYITANRYALEKKLGRALQHGEQALHTCDNMRCVNPAHLFVGTHTDNMRDRARKHRGNHLLGSANGRAKLTEEQVKQIRMRYAAREKSQDALAAEYGVAQTVISKLVLREIWRHV